jgi:hypothetical protein
MERLSRRDDEHGVDVVGDGPPHYSPGPNVEDDPRFSLPLVCWALGDVHDSKAVGAGDAKARWRM